MPNYCSNTILIEADSEADMIEFLKSIGDDEVSDGDKSNFKLQLIHPMPQSLSVSADSRTQSAYEDIYVKKIPPNQLDPKYSVQDIAGAKIYADNKATYGATTWYEWCTSNWGTKWDIDADVASKDSLSISYSFESAWSPPVNALIEGSKNYPRLNWRIDYHEEGSDFIGFDVIKNGETIESMETSLSERQQADVTLTNSELLGDNGLALDISANVFIDVYDLQNSEKEILNIKIKIKDYPALKTLVNKGELYTVFYDELDSDFLEIKIIRDGEEVEAGNDSAITDIVNEFLQNDFDFESIIKTLKENDSLQKNIKSAVDAVAGKIEKIKI